jgi:hypothetical protein
LKIQTLKPQKFPRRQCLRGNQTEIEFLRRREQEAVGYPQVNALILIWHYQGKNFESACDMEKSWTGSRSFAVGISCSRTSAYELQKKLRKPISLLQAIE